MVGKLVGALVDFFARPFRNHRVALLGSTSSVLTCACMADDQFGRLQAMEILAAGYRRPYSLVSGAKRQFSCKSAGSTSKFRALGTAVAARRRAEIAIRVGLKHLGGRLFPTEGIRRTPGPRQEELGTF